MKINKVDLWCIAAPLITLAICIITKTAWIELISSVTGVIYLSLLVKENKNTFLFAIVNVLFLAILTWQKGLPGTAIFNIAYTLPILVYGYVFWNKNQGNDKGKIKLLTPRNRIVLIIVMVCIITAYYLIGFYGFKINNALIDAIIVCCSFIGNILVSFKYLEQWYVFIFLNIVNIAFWCIDAFSDTNSIAIVTMYIIYLINNIIGTITWRKKL